MNVSQSLRVLLPILMLSTTTDAQSPMDAIDWAAGPTTANLGKEARVEVPEHCRFADKKGTAKFMELTQNPVSGGELGVLLCPGPNPDDSPWFVVFTYDASGYVRDDEGATLDADKILASVREGTEAANRERRERGWGTLTIEGWVREPYYDSTTHNLTWSLRAVDETGDAGVNHSVRLLGRGGVMHADLVVDPTHVDLAVAAFDSIVGNYRFVDGRTYAEWREGDKVAAYGLTALVAGGAGAIAMKTGLIGKLWKLIVTAFVAGWKVLAVVGAAIAAKVGSIFKKKSTGPASRTS